ncbi:hypothetical protein Rhopal_007056-T1 [Rhodotorula paludigena]|uniref:ATPase inhibitor, mitochondrial n=1 Tax=Rhodotorula paludigena TaxID=86838 RepID=A0AAV5GUU5_9BASI|nr:hypothetical protein Rhopal_007056-T1 [Rhodotorula paludigena]
MLAAQTLRSAVRVQSRTFAVSARIASEGMPAGHSNDGFKKREQAQEANYVRQAEKEKLANLRKSIEASKAHLAELEKSHNELEKSIGKDSKQ